MGFYILDAATTAKFNTTVVNMQIKQKRPILIMFLNKNHIIRSKELNIHLYCVLLVVFAYCFVFMIPGVWCRGRPTLGMVAFIGGSHLQLKEVLFFIQLVSQGRITLFRFVALHKWAETNHAELYFPS